MKVQLFIPKYTIPPSVFPPYGALYIASALLSNGYEVRIDDCHRENLNVEQLIKRVNEFVPDVVGFSATVATSYKFVKMASFLLKEHFPDMTLIVGGALTSAAEIVLKNTKIDIAVIGEGDDTIIELMKTIEKRADFKDIDGIAYKVKDEIIYTTPRKQIQNIDVLKYPAFELLNMDNYMEDIYGYIKRFPMYIDLDKRFYEPNKRTKFLRLMLSRGCISQCSFCYRQMRGLRHFSFDYMFDYIEHLMDRFKIRQFSFGDECFSSNKKWTKKFIEELGKRKLDIMFQILGMRVDTVDKDTLIALKELGCWCIEYGFESGSQKMLNIMDKHATVQDNINAAKWTKEAGIFTSPAFVIGMPGETKETIHESIRFLKEIDFNFFQYTFAFPVPGTPLYNYSKLKGYITDEDKYLDDVYTANPNNFIETPSFINFTDETKENMMLWPILMKKEIDNNLHKVSLSYRLWVYKNYIKTMGIKNFFLSKLKRKVKENLIAIKTKFFNNILKNK
ncbi:MAG: cobalamin-dependent protein, partial [Nitrospinae bacterium]|nr:cobalamin-dependent protein [Nitrospinota bacterium]